MMKICVVTGSRAEYGLLSRLMKLIDDDDALTLQIIATNTHLSPEFGLTYKEIENDGFTIAKKVEMLLSSDTANGTTKSTGLATIGFADAYEDLRPDLILVLGDRFEIFAAVTAALFYRIPVAHLHGGEITEGAYDDAMRHAITKMSHLHFTSTEDHRRRVVQLGEDPQNVYTVGAIGIDNLRQMHLLGRAELEKDISFSFGEHCALVTFHPATMEWMPAGEQFANLLRALESVPELRMVFTYPNSDTDGRIIMRMINEFVNNHNERATFVPSLGQLRYFSALQFVEGVIGNSSSGVLEAPCFGIPTVNIGSRQRGRIYADSVINCEPSFEDIQQKVRLMLSPEMQRRSREVENPYEKRNTAVEILSVIKRSRSKDLLMKRFHPL
ncbi:MAG TPA: UDP-N-acetylglucosamine 2-epimerase [Bacteroidota bacterium]|nr:UDP-N-acetylglucosamine 2-epimerase [Bacteroidota bacterium]